MVASLINFGFLRYVNKTMLKQKKYKQNSRSVFRTESNIYNEAFSENS